MINKKNAGSATTWALSVVALVAFVGVAALFGAAASTEKAQSLTNGLHIGQAATDRIGFYAATPIVRPANTVTPRNVLINLGLMASGGTDPYLTPTFLGDITITDTKNIILGSTTGTKIGTATTQKLGFFNATPILQAANSVSLEQVLSDFGFRASGTSAPLSIGALSVGTITVAEANNIVVAGSTGMKIGTATSQKLGFYNAAPVVQPSATPQASIADNSTGTATTNTVAAGTGVTTIAIPIELASMTTAAADLITAYTPGYKFKILAVDFATTTIGAGAGASQVLNLEIGTTDVTGGVVTVTLGGTDTLGELSAGTAVSAANTGTAADTISLEVAASGTVFTGGTGVLLVKIQNMDTADAHAAEIARINALRAALVDLGLIKGAP